MTGEHADLFALTNRSHRACVLVGYPTIILSDGDRPLAFVLSNGGGQYVTKRKPQRFTLRPGRSGYFLVAKYRCDGAILHTATSVRVLLPATTGALTLDLNRPGAGGLDYCKRYPGDGRVDPGNRVVVSPIEPTVATAESLP